MSVIPASQTAVKRSVRPQVVVAALLLIPLAVGSLYSALILAAVTHSFEFVLSIAPNNAAALAQKNELLASRIQEKQVATQVGILAKKALVSQVFGTAAIRQLGLALAATGRSEQSGRLMRLSARTSRRDLSAQLWLVENAIAANDVAGALRHYDQALTVFPRVGELLLPILTTATEDQDISNNLAGILIKRPLWRREFMSTLITKSPVAALRLMAAMKKLNFKEDLDLVSQLVRESVARNQNEAAFSAYDLLSKRSEPAESIRNADFTHEDPLPPIDWQYSEPVGVELTHGPADVGLTIASTFSESSEVARQLLRLPAGRHELMAILAEISSDNKLTAHIETRCATDSNTLLGSAQLISHANSSLLSIPIAGCKHQILRVVLDPRKNSNLARIQIRAMKIVAVP
jgi:tetratricopeptide (TPR) repeat protein